MRKLIAFITIVILLGCCLMGLFSCGEEMTTAYTPYDAIECIGKDKQLIINDFIMAGFYNISENTIADLKVDETDNYGMVESISINSISDFDGNTEFDKSAKIIITYHSYRCVTVPFSSDEVKFMDIETILTSLENSGFINIKTDEVFDIDPDTTTAEFENRVTIGGKSNFEKDDEFPLDANIKIATHRPYTKHTLKVKVEFIPNLLFNKYDVEFEISGYNELMSHGTDGEFEYRLKEGTYTLTFRNTEDDSVSGDVEINLTGDTEASYKISCYKEEVSVETRYIENQGEIGEDEAMVPASASSFIYDDYKDVKNAFINAGFTNTSTEILYDIIWGITPEGEVDKVSIDGDSSFGRGDIFPKDALVIITYHMSYEDDPNRMEETTAETTENVSTQNNPTPVFYSSNDFETATQGNTGVFSYVKKGSSYSVYWIINFDEGYVYTFTDDKSDLNCDKVKIVSGTLNDKITITWHDGDMQWSHYLHFKYVSSPVTLVVVDHNGFSWENKTTDLDDALKILSEKRITEY